jgi:hypothetical protein
MVHTMNIVMFYVLIDSQILGGCGKKHIMILATSSGTTDQNVYRDRKALVAVA